MKKIILLLALLCTLMVAVSCNNQLIDSTFESTHKNDAENQTTADKPELTQSSGYAFQKQIINIGQVYDRIVNTTPKSYGRLVAKGDKIIFINEFYNIITSNPDGSEADRIFTSESNGCIRWLMLYEDNLFYVEDNKGLYSIVNNESRILIEGYVRCFEITNEKIFYSITDVKEESNKMYMCDLNGSNKKMIINLDNRQDVDDIFQSTGEIIGQKDQRIYYSVREETGLQYYFYDLAADSHKRIDIEEINKDEIGYYKIPFDTVCVNGICFAVEPDDNEKYILSVTDVETGKVYAHRSVNGDIIHLINNRLYVFSVNENIEYFELSSSGF